MNERKCEPIIWKPQPGEIVEGVLDDVVTILSLCAGEKTYLSLERDGTRYLVFTEPEIRTALNELGIQLGDRVRVSYRALLGRREDEGVFSIRKERAE